ncbi:sialate O-acetylesterase [Pseudomonas sp. NyZ704]|nr:sialate O-acetylesterase [Pseudomonas sp. NyZ704]
MLPATVGFADGLSAQALASRDAENKRLTQDMLRQPNELAQPPTARYNHVITYGQSLASSAEGWPALSVTQDYDNLMLGDSTRSGATSGGAFIPVGGGAFKPLKAVVQKHLEGQVLLEQRQVARLGRQDQAEGEAVEVGALNMARSLYLRNLQKDADPAHLFVASNAATSGRSVSQLLKGGDYDEYKRVIGAVNQASALADASNDSYAISAFFWLQGEYDYSHSNGGMNDRQRYKKLMRQLRKDLNQDTAIAVAGQTLMPAFITYQTDAKHSRKDGTLAVGMAQWELAREEPNWFLAGPVYQYVDKGGHLSANGYRWFGQMLGKVFHRVVVERRQWQPLAPRRATVSGRYVYIDFHVPHPPLAFEQAYIGHEARDIENQGFKLYQDEVEIPIAAVEIVADTVVLITTKQPLAGTPRVTYASYQVGGAGNLRDSDPMKAEARYRFFSDGSMRPEENIETLVDKPYPLQNWSIAFEIEAVSEPAEGEG